jgi:uncharacterized membrane protein
MTERITETGRFLFGISMVGFGIQQFIYKGFLVGVELLPEWLPGHTLWAYATGATFIASGACIAFNKKGRLAASLLGVLFFLSVLLLHVPRIAAMLRDIVERTRAFETLALCGAAWILAGTLPIDDARLRAWHNAIQKTLGPGRYFVAISMAIFGFDHLQAAPFVAALVPSWIPWHLFWVYFSAAGFFAVAVSLATRQFGSVVLNLLGIMFLLWVLVLHTPRVATQLHNGDEWNSAFVALAMCGGAFVAANALQKKNQSQAHPAKS